MALLVWWGWHDELRRCWCLSVGLVNRTVSIIIVIIICELIVHNLTWEWSAAHYTTALLYKRQTKDNAFKK